MARRDGCELYFLTIEYGQRHAIEVERARRIAEAMAVANHVVCTVDLRAIGGSALTADMEVPKDREASERRSGIPITYVPARNLIFLSLAAAHAEVVGATAVYFGANILDYSGYPDCRPEFIRAFESAVREGSRAGVEGRRLQIRTPLINLSKAEIIREGAALRAPLHLTHSCYDPIGESACGRCDSCLIRREGFSKAGLVDPTAYAIL
jgi:7-cyano-7-deazaguanine synthase